MTSQIKERYGLWFKFVSDSLDRGDKMSPETKNAALYFVAQYALEAMKDSSEKIQERREQAERYFHQFAAEMKNLNTMAGDTLAAKAAYNIVVARWNGCNVDQRNSDEMRSYIEKVGYFEWLTRQAEHYPKMETPHFNRLAVASGLRKRELYKEYYESLCNVNPVYKDLNMFDTSKREYNDFVDFRSWLVKEKESSYQRVTSAATAVLLLIAVAFMAIQGVPERSDRVPASGRHAVAAVDLRPHTAGSPEFSRSRYQFADLQPH